MMRRFHNANEYRNVTDELKAMNTRKHSIFRSFEGELIEHGNIRTFISTENEIETLMNDSINLAIVEVVAIFKYLVFLQLQELLTLRGFNISKEDLNGRVMRLIQRRVIQQNFLKIQEKENAIGYIELDYWGDKIAKKINIATIYTSYNIKKAQGIEDKPSDVKKVLVATQIVIGLLVDDVKMDSFMVMEALRTYAAEQKNTNSIFRPTVTISIDKDSVLAYEVVRDSEEIMSRLKDKISRYYELVNDCEYLSTNVQALSAYPQLILCGESKEHNYRIVKALKESGLWRENDPILFTEDTLTYRAAKRSIYGINNDGSQTWYELPTIDNMKFEKDNKKENRSEKVYKRKITEDDNRGEKKCPAKTQHPNKTKLVIGVGCAGVNITNHLVEKADISADADIVAMDSDKQELAKVSNSKIMKLCIGKSITHGYGCGGNEAVALAAIFECKEEIETMIKEYTDIAIIAGMGRGLGATATKYIVELCRKHDIRVSVHSIIPFSYGIATKPDTTAADALEFISHKADMVKNYMNDYMIEKAKVGESIINSFDLINNEILRDVVEWTRTKGLGISA